MNLGELLVGRGLVTRADIDAALERQLVEGGRLGENLIALGLLTADQLSSVIHSTPVTPSTIAETAISQRNLLDLLLKFMHLGSCETVAELADRMKLPHRVIQHLLDDATHQRFVQALGSARTGIASSIRYSLSDQGRTAAKGAADQNLYLGPAPVCLAAYQEQIQDSELRTKYWTQTDCGRASRGLWFPSITFASSCRRSTPGARCCYSGRRATARRHLPRALRRSSET
jgi:hypothetical protein